MTINSRFMKLTKLVNLSYCHFLHTMSVFINHIYGIGAFGSEEKMLGINTISDITSMTNQNAFWNWPNEEFITNPMCKVKTFIKSKSSISRFDLSGSPYPTGISFVNFVQESIFMFHELLLNVFENFVNINLIGSRRLKTPSRAFLSRTVGGLRGETIPNLRG